jgi:hypothetical protein
MRYLKHVETDEIRQVPHDDDVQLEALKAERLANGRVAWTATGFHDPAVAAVAVAPLVELDANLPATATAVDYDQAVGDASKDGTVTAVTYTPEALITGADTNSRTLTIVNKGQAGAGNTVIATLALTAGVNAPAFDEKPFVLSVVAGAKAVVEGDVLVAVSTHVGTGLADPGGKISISINPALV